MGGDVSLTCFVHNGRATSRACSNLSSLFDLDARRPRSSGPVAVAVAVAFRDCEGHRSSALVPLEADLIPHLRQP
jgi:hypothetical protein